MTPYRAGIRATVEIYLRRAAEGRLIPAEHGITVAIANTDGLSPFGLA